LLIISHREKTRAALRLIFGLTYAARKVSSHGINLKIAVLKIAGRRKRRAMLFIKRSNRLFLRAGMIFAIHVCFMSRSVRVCFTKRVNSRRFLWK
jgi:hypothetical protein